MPGRGEGGASALGRCSSCHRRPLLPPSRSRGKRGGCQPGRQHLPAAGTPSRAGGQPVRSRPPPAVVASVLPRSGSARPRERSVPELPAAAGSPPPPSPHASEGPLTPCSFLGPGAARRAPGSLPLRPPARRPPQARQPPPGPPAGPGHGGPGSSPPAPALRSLPPSPSGVGEVRLGAAGVWGSSSASGARRGLGRFAGGIMSGILAPPGNPAFPNAGRPWRDLPSNVLSAGENRPACKLELNYLGGNCLQATSFPKAETAGQITRQRE